MDMSLRESYKGYSSDVAHRLSERRIGASLAYPHV